jgi:hypothetical protein
MPTQCFFLDATDRARRSLRRFVFSDREKCPAPDGPSYHNAENPFDTCQVFVFEDHWDCEHRIDVPHHDSRWPRNCKCGYEFQDVDEWQIFTERIYRQRNGGEETTLREAKPGAMWNADWYPKAWQGEDGMCLVCICPNGCHWIIDGRATNCTKPEDNNHKCWCRHGAVPNITVDKECVTCEAGAGSIQAGDYHGFLQNGVFNP